MAEIKTPVTPDKTAQPAVGNKAAKDTPPMQGGSPPAPTTKEAAAPANEGKPAPNIGKSVPQPPAPSATPALGKVVSFDSISGTGPEKLVDDAKLQQEQEAL